MAFSFNRENTISKRPEVVAQRDASTDKTTVHFRSSVGGCISEKSDLLECQGRHARLLGNGLHHANKAHPAG
jgi:acetoin utilization deacetylase AcuC-like enzyme